jgi:hypothetical protein
MEAGAGGRLHSHQHRSSSTPLYGTPAEPLEAGIRYNKINKGIDEYVEWKQGIVR